MGCNLKDLASPEAITMNELSGKKIGIDAYLVAFQFLTTIRDRSPTGDGMPLKGSHGRIVAHLMGFLGRMTHIISAGVQPVCIFDGRHPELKLNEVKKRKAKSKSARIRWQDAIDTGDYQTAQKLAPQCVRYTQEMVDETKQMLDLLGVTWVQAAAEGEGQGAVMTANGQLDAMATQDWDALLYGSPVLIRNLMSDGSRRRGRIIRAERILLQDVLTTHGITQNQLVDLAIMIGTDFHPGIRGIGPKTGLKLIKEHGSIEVICGMKDISPPDNLNEIRDIFLQHPTTSVAQIEPGVADEAGLREFLQAERGFSDKRVNDAIGLLKSAGAVRQAGQTSLLEF